MLLIKKVIWIINLVLDVLLHTMAVCFYWLLVFRLALQVSSKYFTARDKYIDTAHTIKTDMTY